MAPTRLPRWRTAVRMRSRRSASATAPFERRSSGPRASGASPRARSVPGRSSSPGKGGRRTGACRAGRSPPKTTVPSPVGRDGRRRFLQPEEVLPPVEIAVDEEAPAPVGPAREGVEERELVRVDGRDLDGRHEERPERGGAAEAHGRRGEGRPCGDGDEREEEKGVPDADVVGRPGGDEEEEQKRGSRGRRRSGATRAPRGPRPGRGGGRGAPSRRARRGSTRASLRGRPSRGSSSLRPRRRSGARRRACR